MPSNAKIVTLTLNPAIDWTAFVPDFTQGEVNRVETVQADPGGKGVNVASFLSHFGQPVAATGLLGVENISGFLTLCEEKGIEDFFVRCPGATRVNVKIVEAEQDKVTDVNFPGLDVGEEQVQLVHAAIDHLLRANGEIFVLAGSLPMGMPASIYADLTAKLKREGKRVVLDTSGAGFAPAIAAGPDVIKPNIDELRDLTGKPLENHQEILAAARALNETVALVVVSMGADGALFTTRDEAVLAVPPKAVVRSTVGAGDAMVSGVVHGLIEGLPLAEMAQLATGFSLGALAEIGPRLPSPDAIGALAKTVTIERLD